MIKFMLGLLIGVAIGHDTARAEQPHDFAPGHPADCRKLETLMRSAQADYNTFVYTSKAPLGDVEYSPEAGRAARAIARWSRYCE